MDKVTLNALSKNQRWFTPWEAIMFCVKASDLANKHEMREAVVNLETQALENYREFFEGAVFAFGLSHLQENSELLLSIEGNQNSDYDLHLGRRESDKMYVRPLQLKRMKKLKGVWSPSLQDTVTKLVKKYADASDLSVLIYAEGMTSPDIWPVSIPKESKITEVFLMGSDLDTRKFCIFGEIVSQTRYDYKFSLSGTKP